MKLKKCLITSLSFGLSAITIGAVASGCADNSSAATKATDPNPASDNSLSTNPGDPLTPEQQAYQQKLAAEIKVQFDANAKLDYSNPEDKANIDSQILEYKKAIDDNDQYSNFLKKLLSLDSTMSSFDEEFTNLFVNFYETFKQKNLLPTEQEITDNLSIIAPGANPIPDWKIFSGEFALFYINPNSFILLAQLSVKINYNADQNSANSDEDFNLSIGLCSYAYSLLTNDILNKNETSYLALQYYEPVLLEINNLLFPILYF